MTTPDRGLRYELAAVIGGAGALSGVAAVLGVEAVPLDAADLVLLPVTAELAGEVTPAALCALGVDVIPGGTPYAAKRREGWLTGRESGFTVLTPGLVAVMEAASTRGPLAYVEADYLDLHGRQTAAVWRAGILVKGPLLLGRHEEFVSSTAPVSVALRELGVVATGRRDEFVVAGLGRHHRTAEWSRPDRRRP